MFLECACVAHSCGLPQQRLHAALICPPGRNSAHASSTCSATLPNHWPVPAGEKANRKQGRRGRESMTAAVTAPSVFLTF